MAPYELTQATEKDFGNIFDFGIDTFGLAQVIDYQQDMRKQLQQLNLLNYS